jgi:hypothetical protein
VALLYLHGVANSSALTEIIATLSNFVFAGTTICNSALNSQAVT